MLRLLTRLYKKNNLERDETVFLLKHLNEKNRPVLFQYARQACEQYYGNDVYMRGLIEFSNVCRRNCFYCGIRGANNKLERYRLSGEAILDCCARGYNLGFRTFVLQSGEDPWYTTERVIELIREIKRKYPDTALTLSIGERSREEYEKMFQAGADRYLLRHETASQTLYEALHPDMRFTERIKCLYNLKEIGYQVGAGFMVGLPGQSAQDLAEDLHFLKKLDPHMIGIGPFIPHRETPLKGARGGLLEYTLDMIALARLFIPDSLMPATTAMGSLDKAGREKAIMAGANVVMPNLTPVSYKAKYRLYENKICLEDEAEHCRYCIEGKIRKLGRQVDMGVGDCKKTVHNSQFTVHNL